MSKKSKETNKNTSATDRLFAPTKDTEPALQKVPKQENEKMIRKNIYIPLEQSDWLEEFCFNIKRASGTKISQSQIIAKLIEVLRYKNIDISSIDDISDLEYHFLK